MDRDVWMLVMRATRSLGPMAPRRRRVEYSDRVILRLYLWLCAHDLPLCRVVDPDVYPSFFRPRSLPSVSQFCKRVATPAFEALLERVRRRLTGAFEGVRFACIDGKALPVTENTRDKDAATGHGGGRFCKGFRLHGLCDDRGRLVDYRVTDMRVQEKNMAFEMLHGVPRGLVVFADGNYDSSRLYDTARARGAYLLTPLKAFATDPATLRQMSPARREAGEAWREHPRLVKRAYAKRGAIERAFANLSNFAGGLRGLPPWVRSLPRVRRFVAAKLVLYQARRLVKHPSASAG